MSPVKRAAELLGEHTRVIGMRLATCGCGWEEPLRGRPAGELHARHQAQVLADAGLIPEASQ